MNLRKLVLPVLIFFFGIPGLKSQNIVNDFSTEWKKVESLQKKGLTQSALSEVQAIYSLAKKNNNQAQIIKSLLFKMSLQEGIMENAWVKNLDSVQTEINTSTGPAKAILQSIAAEMYWSYFQQNRYKFYSRTNTTGFEKNDIATWTSADLHEKTAELFLSSLSNEKMLQQTKLAPFDAIISKGNARNLRPSLYDLLAHRALDYFKNDERDIAKPAYAFEISSDAAFAPAAQFIRHSFATKDTSSLQQKALVIFQKLLAFHLNDKNPDAFIDVNIERLEFVNQYGVMDSKDESYIEALKQISEKYSQNEISSYSTFLRAQAIYNLAEVANRNKNTTTPWTVAMAKKILDSVIKKFPASRGGIMAQNLRTQILHPEISLTSEKVNIPGQPFRTLVSYKNADAIYIRIIPLSTALRSYLKNNNDDNEKEFSRLLKEKVTRQWKQDIPETNDYVSHSVEIKTDGLPVGEYVMLAGKDANFTMSNNPMCAQIFYVSNISYVGNNRKEYFVLNRTTGSPLPGAKVQIVANEYNYQDRKYSQSNKEVYTTDRNGYFRIAIPSKEEITELNRSNRSIALNISYQNDHLFPDDFQSMYFNYGEKSEVYRNQKDLDKEKARIFFFTDRSIYRPGQIVYFKGIGVTENYLTKKSILLSSGDSVTVMFKDANGATVDSMQTTLNEFGSFNGKFKIPENKMNGRFSIVTKQYRRSSTSFSVEEYKRPKFFAEFEKAKGSYRLNDTVTVSGFARAYAGNQVDGAKVTYRVTRVARFIYPWLFRSKIWPVSRPVEIAHGEITTDSAGRFSISFAAIPDRQVDKKTDPVFDYQVEADVTDINGETRSGSITIPVGYKSINLQIGHPAGEMINSDSTVKISLGSTNLSGEPEPVKAIVQIFKINAPQRLIRERLWDTPDQFLFTKDEFIRYFPHDEYKDELDKENWEKGALVYEKSDTVSKETTFKPADLKLGQGWYVIEATAKDANEMQVKDVRYFQVFDPGSDHLPAPAYSWNKSADQSFQPGETAYLMMGTSAENVFLISEIANAPDGDDGTDSTHTTFSFDTLNRAKRSFSYKITEDALGGFGVNRFYVKDNRIHIISNKVLVPWSSKKLNIAYETYRDKTLPGSAEKWKVKISGNKGEKVAAEMLAGMYDASLDQFAPHSWQDLQSVWPVFSGYNRWNGSANFTTVNSFEKYWSPNYVPVEEIVYDQLKYIPYFGYPLNDVVVTAMGVKRKNERAAMERMDMQKASPSANAVEFGAPNIVKDEEAIGGQDSVGEVQQNNQPDQSAVQVRKNFNETAFFFPDLRTDADGNIEFSFTMPEALTKWKLMTMAHTKALASGYAEKSVITQKELMVQPNTPRFLREGDKMDFSAKIVNLAENKISGQAELQLLNAATMNPVDKWFRNLAPIQNFSVAAGQSSLVTFTIDVPENFNEAVVFRIVAKAGNISDGEEAAIPVVTNRMLVTESLPLPVRGEGSKEFTFDKLLHSGNSKTLTNYGITVEYTTNPAWYAVQALPYLTDYPYECSEQNFNRFYANALALKIANSSPRMKAIMEKWRTADTAALLSNLQKNEDLKSVLLQETPWVLQAQNEAQQKKNIALLFDIVAMGNKLESALQKLVDMQTSNGGFVWFKGGPDNRYITQYIITGIGHLQKLQADPSTQSGDLNSIVSKALPYLDRLLKEEYDNLVNNKADLQKNQLSADAVQYLYMRSFFPQRNIAANTQKAYSYYFEQAKKYWLSQTKYMQGMIALAMNRANEPALAKGIIKSLKENAIRDTELGLYWKEWNTNGYWWYQAPIESQALMIEAFSEIDADASVVGDLKTWLLKNKQTNNWRTTKATSEAVYALLLQGTDWISEEKKVVINLGNTTIRSTDEKQEAGTGYFKRKIEGHQVSPQMGNIKVTVASTDTKPGKSAAEQSPSWGSVYWQYFEDLDKITFAETPLKLTKKLFIERNTDKGPVLISIEDSSELHVGDKIKVRIELRADRDMEYVHMKDMRASCMEPTNVLSGYKFQDGLGYYETTKDVSTNFFFSYLRKGTYVFEYPMFVTHSGNFSNGVTTIQCMYAPEFTAHSEGVRVTVK